MACDCIKNIEEKLKSQYGETACVNKGYMSDGTVRVVAEGLYHKAKRNGGHEQKWTEVSLLATYCPFCGKPYEEPGKKAVKED